MVSEQEKAKERRSTSTKEHYAAGHYHIVEKMINYHAIDFGDKCKLRIVRHLVRLFLTFHQSSALVPIGCMNKSQETEG